MTGTDYKRDTICPHCNYVADAVGSISDEDDRSPEDGDFTICIQCGEFAVFDGRFLHWLRKPDDRENATIAGDPELQHLRRAWLFMDSERAKRKRG